MNRLENITGFLLDMDGTFYLGKHLIDGALRFIDIIQKQEKEFLFLTNNSSKNRHDYALKIKEMGLNITQDKVFTSGGATAIFLKREFPTAKIFLVGTSSLQEEFKNWGFELEHKEPDIAVLGFDTTLTYKKLWRLCDLVRSGIPYVATHPDFNCPTESGFMPDIGAMIAFVRASTGRVPDFVIGKPNRFIVDAAAELMNKPIEQLAIVGDRLYTDIALGESSGITTILVLSGETKLEDLESSLFKPNFIFNSIAELTDTLDSKIGE